MTIQQKALLWLLFFLICLGLGYPSLNRYDPGKLQGTSDAAQYRDIVIGRPSQRASGGDNVLARLAQQENYYRVLVPYVAKPFYWLTRATPEPGIRPCSVCWRRMQFSPPPPPACWWPSAINSRLRFPRPCWPLPFFSLNFCVANLDLAGLVDSAEGCFLMLIVWTLLAGRWYLLPLWGVFGALAKETFAPLSFLFAAAWWLAEVRRGRPQLARLAWVSALGVAGITTVTVVMSRAAGGLVYPWQFAASMRAGTGFLLGLRGCLLDHTFWYVFIWLLPLGLVRWRRLPRPWTLATCVAFCGALVLGAFNNARGNTARALFNVSGPLLSFSAAYFLAGLRDSAGGASRSDLSGGADPAELL